MDDRDPLSGRVDVPFSTSAHSRDMENDNEWQALGAVIARVLARTEGLVIDRTPIPEADAALFVSLVRGELPGGLAKPSAARRTEGRAEEEAHVIGLARRAGGGS